MGATMITGHVFIATSFDGFVARRSGELNWLMKQEKKSKIMATTLL